jgi:hypothetical protein
VGRVKSDPGTGDGVARRAQTRALKSILGYGRAHDDDKHVPFIRPYFLPFSVGSTDAGTDYMQKNSITLDPIAIEC